VALRVPLYRPISRAGEVDAPPFLTVARGDRIVPPSAAERLARRLDHVDVYHGAPFERAVAEQAAFLARHLR
jgi:pimeloyl-ACP methyl ester carboxylesterase